MLVNSIKITILFITLAISIIGCGSSARVISLDGNSLIVDKISPTDGAIIFRTGSESQKIKIKSLHYIDIFHDSTVIFSGENWLSSTIRYLDKEDSSTISGWVLPTTEIAGFVKKNSYRGYLSDITRINLAYEADDAAALEDSSATQTTDEK